MALSFVFPAVAGANQHCLFLSRLLSAATPPPYTGDRFSLSPFFFPGRPCFCGLSRLGWTLPLHVDEGCELIKRLLQAGSGLRGVCGQEPVRNFV